MASKSLDQLEQLRLIDHLYVKRPGLIQFRSRFLPGDDVGGFPAHRASHFAPCFLNALLSFLTRQRRKAAGKNKRQSGEFGALDVPPLVSKTQSLRPQAVHQISIALLMEETADALRDFRSHFLGPLQVVFACPGDRVHLAKGIRQELRRSFAHKWDSEAVQDTRQRLLPGRINIAKQLFRRLLAHPFEFHQLTRRQTIKVRQIRHQALVDKLIHQRVTQAVDIHDAPRREVQNGFF